MIDKLPNQFWKYHQLILAALLFLLVFLKLGQHPISPWDEARTGVNAIEMLQKGDWVNLNYAGQPDNWNAKPPLMTWCVAGCFSMFGFNEFSLRLPSALAIILAFLLIYKIIILYKSEWFAFWACMILFTAKGLIGWHAGRTGDHDAMLVCALMLGLYFFLLWFDFDKKNKIYLAGLFFGLAFMAKGPAMMVLFPGIILYAFITGRFKKLIGDHRVLFSALICLAFPLIWFFIVDNYGVEFENAKSGDNVFQRLFLYDLWERFTNDQGNWKKAFGLGFFFYSVDKMFNVWSIVFFGILVYGLSLLVLKKKYWFYLINNSRNRLLLLSLCLYFPLTIFLTLASKSNSWYLAPVIPFVGIIIFHAISYFWYKWKFIKFTFFSILLFTSANRLQEFNCPKSKPELIARNCDILSNSKQIKIIGHLEQDILLYTYFCNQNVQFGLEQTVSQNNSLLFVENQQLASIPINGFEILDKDETYSILREN